MITGHLVIRRYCDYHSYSSKEIVKVRNSRGQEIVKESAKSAKPGANTQVSVCFCFLTY